MFDGHSGPVFCCALNREGDIAVTGGEDDKAFLWTTNSDGQESQILQQLDFQDSVIDVGFNCDETLIACIDMEGFVQVISSSNYEVVYDYDIGADINFIRWHPNDPDILLVGTQTDASYVLSIRDYSVKNLHGPGGDNPAGTFFSDGQRAVIGYENGIIRIWDINESRPIHTVRATSAHTDSVISLHVKHDDSLLASGSLDSTAKLISPQSGKVVATLECGMRDDKAIDKSNSVESLEFCKIHPILATGSLNGLLEIWDLHTSVKKSVFECEQGISKVGWCPKTPHLICVAGLDGNLRIVDGRDGSLVSVESGHQDQILDFSVASNNYTILTCSGDGTSRVFNYSDFK